MFLQFKMFIPLKEKIESVKIQGILCALDDLRHRLCKGGAGTVDALHCFVESR